MTEGDTNEPNRDLIYGLSRDCGRSPYLAILDFSCPMGIVLWLGVEK